MRIEVVCRHVKIDELNSEEQLRSIVRLFVILKHFGEAANFFIAVYTVHDSLIVVL